MPSQNLLAQIHIGKKALGLTDPEYRDMLFSVTEKESSKDITDPEAHDMIRHLKACGWTPQFKAGTGGDNRLRFEEYGIRHGFATPVQLRKIHATWMTSKAVREKTDKALNHYLERIFKITHFRFVPSGTVGKILRAIEGLK